MEITETPAPLPPIVAVVTLIGLTYAVGEPYPNLPPEGASQVAGTVLAIHEIEHESDDTGTAYMIRASGEELAPGYVWQERIAGSAVVGLARAMPEELLSAAEQSDEDNANAGIDVRRVLLRMGPLTVCFEEGRSVPEVAGFPSWLRGKIGRIFRTEDGSYRIRIAVDPVGPIEPGSVVALTVTQATMGLEVLPEAEALEQEEKARLAQLQMLQEMLEAADEDEDETEGDARE